MRPISRRRFLRGGAAAGLWLLVGCRVARPGDEPPPTPIPLPTPIPRELLITAVGDFYIMTHDSTPEVDRAQWSLRIEGLVERPLTLNWDDVITRPAVTQMRTVECIGNAVGGDQIGNAVWTGVALAPVLAEAGVLPGARYARFTADDGYRTAVRRRWIEQPEALLAYEMNGAPLTADHGYPLRLFMPGLYGQKMPKWITGITFAEERGRAGFWEAQGWSDTAAVKTNSQFFTPRHIAPLPLGPVAIAGVAYGGGRAITAVEVGVERDGALTWYPADLLPGPTPAVWTQFYLDWTPPVAGVYTLLVRATDETGFVQTERARGILEGAFPDGTDKIHSIVVKVG